MQFYVKVDEFSLLEFDSSFGSVVGGEVTVQVLVGDVISSNKTWRFADASEEWVVPFFTAIVQIDSGAPQSVAWDDGCLACGGSDCKDGFCSQPWSECGGSVDCDLKIYLGWIGLDANDHYCTSAGMRLSQFRRWTLGEIYSNAAETASEQAPTDAPSVSVPDNPAT